MATTHATTNLVGEGVGFERIRRITGYLVGTIDRFNDAKRAEELVASCRSPLWTARASAM